MAKEALEKRSITTPSGREFSFPDVERRMNGSVSHFTQIKNYPVQGFATADIVPVVLLEMEKRLSTMKSCIVNTVHDSVVIDIHPEEEEKIISLVKNMNDNLTDLINNAFAVKLNVPMLLEAKIGPNWLDTKDVA